MQMWYKKSGDIPHVVSFSTSLMSPRAIDIVDQDLFIIIIFFNIKLTNATVYTTVEIRKMLTDGAITNMEAC